MNAAITTRTFRKRAVDAFFQLMFQSGFDRVLRGIQKNQLTVINYHRIDDPGAAGIVSFKPNISATPAEFARQLDYLKSRFNIVNTQQIVNHLDGGSTLPPNAALITFDDGYLDNLTHALPILRDRGCSALIFLTTNFIDRKQTAYWDYAAACFYLTAKESVDLPLLGPVSWMDGRQKDRILLSWVERVKMLPVDEKYRALGQLPVRLDVCVPQDELRGLFMNWDQVRQAAAGGMEIGSHTVSHPILSRISAEQVQMELNDARYRIEAELGREISTFAYPNGQARDFSPEIVSAVRDAGYKLAFTLVNGMNEYDRLPQDRLTIRRIFIHHRDTLERFAARVNGWYRG